MGAQGKEAPITAAPPPAPVASWYDATPFLCAPQTKPPPKNHCKYYKGCQNQPRTWPRASSRTEKQASITSQSTLCLFKTKKAAAVAVAVAPSSSSLGAYSSPGSAPSGARCGRVCCHDYQLERAAPRLVVRVEQLDAQQQRERVLGRAHEQQRERRRVSVGATSTNRAAPAYAVDVTLASAEPNARPSRSMLALCATTFSAGDDATSSSARASAGAAAAPWPSVSAERSARNRRRRCPRSLRWEACTSARPRPHRYRTREACFVSEDAAALALGDVGICGRADRCTRAVRARR